MANFLLTGDALHFDTLSQAFQAKSTLELPQHLPVQVSAGSESPAAERSRVYLQAQAVTTGPETEESIIRLFTHYFQFEGVPVNLGLCEHRFSFLQVNLLAFAIKATFLHFS